VDATRFDNLTRALDRRLARRAVLAGTGGLAALLTRAGLDGAAAKKGKNKKKPLKLNEYGCVNVGGRCRGKDSVCCSGICEGKRPKKVKRDKSRCVAHNTGGCPAGQRVPFCGGTTLVHCTITSGVGTFSGVCDTTTGNAPYCTGDGECFPCKKDTDCVPVCGEGAACAKCPTGCAATGGTVCVSRPGLPLNLCIVPGPP
jgi:hypothetical protein